MKTALLLAVVVGILSLGSMASAWADSNYGYYSTFVLNYTGGNTTNAQANVTLNTSSLIAAGKMQADCDDVRPYFYNTSDSSETLVNYWLESCGTSANSTLWLNLTLINNTNTTVRVYYGYASATNSSNSSKVFITQVNNLVGAWLFDDIGDTVARDSSGYGANLTMENSAIVANTDRYGGALNITAAKGNASVAVAPQLRVTSNITAIGWVKQPSTVSSYYVMASTGYTKEFDFSSQPALPRMIMYRNGAAKYTDVGSFAGAYWNNFIYVADTGFTTARVNKTAIWSSTALSGSSGTYNFTIGMRPDDSSISTPVGTLFDNVYIFNATLSNATLDMFTDYMGYATPNLRGVLFLRKILTSDARISYLGETAASTFAVTVSNPSNTTYTLNYSDKLALLNFTVNGSSALYSCNNSLDGTVFSTYLASNNTAHSEYFTVSTYGSHTVNVTCNTTTETNERLVSFFAKYTSNISLNSTAGFSFSEGTPTVLSCGSNGATPTLTRDGVVIPNNYSWTPTVGVYNLTCALNSTDSLYFYPNVTSSYVIVTGGAYGCYNTSTFAFQKNFTNINFSYPVNVNFTSLHSSGMVRYDLGDIQITPSGNFNVTRNISTGSAYLILVNNTASNNFTVSFGNYPLANTYDEGTNGSQTLNMSGYAEISPSYYIINLLDEKATNTSLMPAGANTTISVMCSNGTSNFITANTSVLVASNSDVSQIRVFVVYSSTDLYYRDRLTAAPIETINVYLVQGTLYSIVQTVFKLDDRTGDFSSADNARIIIKRLLDGNLKTVTELPVDIENKAITYLVNGDKYQFYVENDAESRAIGDIYADSSALTKTVTIIPTVAQNLSIYNTSFTLTESGGIINFVWLDEGANTNNVTLWIYNKTSGALMTTLSTINRSTVNFVYDTGDANGNYTAVYKIKHDIYGNNTIGGTVYFFGAAVPALTNPILILLVALGGNVFWFTMIFMAPLAMALPRRFIGVSAFLFVGVMALLTYYGWLAIPIQILGIGLLIAIMIEANEIRKRR